MALLDIREGDFFISGGITYLVKAVAEWSHEIHSLSARYALRATTIFSTQRNPAVSGGKRGTPEPVLTNQSCMKVKTAE